MNSGKTWMLALLLASACGDDDGDDARAMSGDPATAGDASISGSSDASGLDAGTPTGDVGDAGSAPLAILGRWHTNFMYTEEISATSWGFANLVEYDNQARVAITQNPSTAMLSPGTYNKNVWTPVQGGVFYYCTTDFALPTVEAARASTKAADATDLLNKGCAGFGWTQMSPVIEIEGSWLTSNGPLAIDSDMFGDDVVASYDNAQNSAVIGSLSQGDAGVLGFRKLIWTPSASELLTCLAPTRFATQEEAAASTSTADATVPATGCYGGAWTSLTKP
jgi:hypothetical protein